MEDKNLPQAMSFAFIKESLDSLAVEKSANAHTDDSQQSTVVHTMQPTKNPAKK